MARDELLLVVDDPLQSVEFFFRSLDTLHRAVVDATHTDGKHVATLRRAHLVEAFGPVAAHLVGVGDVVEAASLRFVPFAHVVAQEWFAVRGAYGYAAAVGHELVFGIGEERGGAGVHGGPYGVGTQTHKEFEDFFVGARPDGA